MYSRKHVFDPLPPTICFMLYCSRAQKNECGPYQELAKLCGQDKGVAELAAFAQSKQAEFEAVSGSVCSDFFAICKTQSLSCDGMYDKKAAAWSCSHLPHDACHACASLNVHPPFVALQDGNVGLVKLVIEGQARRQIQKLTQTYLTLRWAARDCMLLPRVVLMLVWASAIL
jgi:hypothetical protein